MGEGATFHQPRHAVRPLAGFPTFYSTSSEENWKASVTVGSVLKNWGAKCYVYLRYLFCNCVKLAQGIIYRQVRSWGGHCCSDMQWEKAFLWRIRTTVEQQQT